MESMPFDAVDFSKEAEARHAATSPTSLRSVWRALLQRVHDTVGRTQPGATVALLNDAREMLESERLWIQGRYVMGNRRCAMGALQDAGRQYRRRVRLDAAAVLTNVARSHGFSSVEQMNDTVTHGEVLAAFDLAVTRARLHVQYRV
jgi:hypothetical protein